MARPTKYDQELGQRIVDLIGAGATNAEAAGVVGIAPTTVQNWLARGRRGMDPYDAFATAFDEAVERDRLRRIAVYYAREAIRSKASWQAFKAQRERWWIGHLGPVEFWRRRLLWCLDRGKDRGADRARSELAAAIAADREREAAG